MICFYRYPLPELNEEEKDTARGIFHRAALIGSTTSDGCMHHFSACPFNSEQLIKIVENDEEDGQDQ